MEDSKCFPSLSCNWGAGMWPRVPIRRSQMGFESEASEDLETHPRRVAAAAPQLPDAPASSARAWAHQQWQQQCLHRRSCSKVALGHHSWLDSLQAQPLVSPLPRPPPGLGHLLMALGAQTCAKDQPSIVGLQVLCAHRGGGRRHLLNQSATVYHTFPLGQALCPSQ